MGEELFGIAIVGSRDFQNLHLIDRFVATLPPGTLIITGGARGVDKRAEIAAKKRGLPVKIFYPDWVRHGKAAGFIRNKDIVNAATEVVAFWDGVSRGTQHSMRLAKMANKKLTVVRDLSEIQTPWEEQSDEDEGSLFEEEKF